MSRLHILENPLDNPATGDKIRIEPNTVLFLDPAAYRDVYGPKANVQRCNTYLVWSRNGNEFNTITTVAPAAHGRKRKMLNQAFTEKAIKNAASFISQHVDRWIELISETAEGETWTKSRNMASWNDWLVFDILGDLCFGRSFDTKEPGPNPIRDIPHHIVNYCRFFYPVGVGMKILKIWLTKVDHAFFLRRLHSVGKTQGA